MKPSCKAESRWLYWRTENPKNHRDRFSQWAKKQMVKARRRHYKNICPQCGENHDYSECVEVQVGARRSVESMEEGL